MTGALFLLAAALSAGNADFDRTAAEGAARITFARARQALLAEGPKGDVLRPAMLADPERFRTRADAEAAGRALYLDEVARQYEKACAAIRRDLALSDDFTVAFTPADEAQLAARYPAAFAAARAAAVAEQAQGIVSATRPTEAEFEEKDVTTLRREMTARIVAEQKTPVFEENVDYISTRIVDPVLARAKESRKWQEDQLLRAHSSAMAPSRLADDLTARLREAVAGRARKEGPAAWGVFPSVLTNALPRAVTRRTLERVTAEIAHAAVDISPEDVMHVIADDPAAHVRQSESAKIFRADYAARLRATAHAQVVGETPADERTELDAFLTAHREDETVVKAIDRTLQREVMPKWKAARTEVATRQANTVWPALLDGTWYPETDFADRIAARSDYTACVKAWRKLSEMAAFVAAEESACALEEARARADQCVVRAFDCARNAVAAQKAVVEAAHPSLLETLRQESQAHPGAKPDVKRIAGRLTDMVETRWNEIRLTTLWPEGDVPSNADAQHVALFPSVRRQIELLAKVILEELDLPKPEETPPEEPPEEKLEFTLSVRREGASVELKLLNGQNPVYEKRLDSRLAPFGAAMKDVADKLGRDLLKLK